MSAPRIEKDGWYEYGSYRQYRVRQVEYIVLHMEYMYMLLDGIREGGQKHREKGRQVIVRVICHSSKIVASVPNGIISTLSIVMTFKLHESLDKYIYILTYIHI